MVVTGDFNSRGDTERYGVLTGAEHDPPLLRNTGDIAPPPMRRFKGLNRNEGVIPEDEEMMLPVGRIDHIFAGGPCPVEVSSWILDARSMKAGEDLSDHELIAAELEFGAV